MTNARTALRQEALHALIQHTLQRTPMPELLAGAAHILADGVGTDGLTIYERTKEDDLTSLITIGTAVSALPTVAPASWLTEVLANGGFAHPFTLTPMGEAATSSAAFAIPGEERAWGLLVALRAQPFGTEDLLFLSAAAAVLAGVFARAQAEVALHESEARAQAILETTVDAIITIDESGYILSFNRSAERIFGYAAQEVVGQNVSMLMPEPYHSEHDAYLESYHTTGRRKIIGIGREVRGRRRDGSVFPMYLAVSEVYLPDRLLFTGIVRDITERRHLEQEVLRVSEEERRRIGQDLHDGLGQMLTGIGLIAGGLARRLRQDESAGATEIAEIAEMVKEADQYARGLARGLVPVELEQGGLRGALERLAHNAERLFGIRCSFTERGTPRVEDPNVAGHLYRIAQEAVSNAVRHGKASTVAITLDAGPGYLRLRIRDDGRGFTNVDLDAPPEALDTHRGMGVRIMHYRARILGAALDIAGKTGEGTVVTCTLRHAVQTNHEEALSA